VKAWNLGDPCPNVLVLGARGSGEERDSSGAFTPNSSTLGVGAEVYGFSVQLANIMSTKTVEILANPYPAVPISEGLPAIFDSVDQGRTDTRVLVAAVTQECGSSTKIVLAGYSQGALVAKSGAEYVRTQDQSAIGAIAILADPQFDPHGGGKLIGSFNSTKGGALGEVDIPSFAKGRTASLCLSGDPVCQGGAVPDLLLNSIFSSTVHTHGYQDASWLKQLASVIAGFLSSSAPAPTLGRLDLVFAIDTTGSMGPYIQSAVSVADAVVSSLAGQVDYRVGLVDYKDADNCSDYDAVTDLPFSTSQSAIVGAIDALPAKIGGGCDTPEDVYSGLMRAIGFPWRAGVTKVIIVMGDAPPKDPEPHTGFTASSVIAAANAVDPASINPVLVGGDPQATAAFASLASGTGGEVFDSASSDVGSALLDAVDTAVADAQCSTIVTTPPKHGLVANSGELCVRNTTVPGSIAVGPKGSLSIEGSTVSGDIVDVGGGLDISGSILRSVLSIGAPSPTLCDSHIASLAILNASGLVQIGSPAGDGCGPNAIAGGLDLLSNHGDYVVYGNSISGSLGAQLNVGFGEISANQIHGTLDCIANEPSPFAPLENSAARKLHQCAGL